MDTEDVIAMDGATLLRWIGMIALIPASIIFIIQWLTPKLRKLFYNNTQSESDGDEIRIIIVGKTGVGKSELANSLLGGSFFNAKFGMSSVTSTCSCKEQYIDYINATLKLIDTPGLFDTTKPNDVTTKVLTDCIKLSKPGPHVFILVVSLASRFTPEDQKTIEYVEKIFSETSRKFMIVVFTNKQCSDVDIDEKWVRHADQEPLKPLLEKCNYRFSSINNKGKEHDIRKDVKSIIDVIKQTITDNNNDYYTGQMFEAAEKIYTEVLEEKAKNESLEKTIERLEKEREEYLLRHEGNIIKSEPERNITEDVDQPGVINISPNSYNVQSIPIGYFKNASNVGALVQESSSIRSVPGDTTPEIFKLQSYTDLGSGKISQRSRGKMSEKEYKIIQSNYTMLLDNIQPDELCQALFEKAVFDEDDLEQIKKEEHRGRKAVTEKLLQLLMRCGNKSFNKFMECLLQTGHVGIHRHLQPGDVTVGNVENKTEENKTEENKSEENKTEENKTEQSKKEDLDNNVKSDVGYNIIHPLHEESLICKDMEMYKIIVDKYIQKINTTDWLGSTPLLKACISKYHPIDKLILLQQSGADINKTIHNNNALHLACDLGSLNTVIYLIEELHFDIETPGFTGRTPLHQSSQSAVSPVEKIDYLISKGVNVKTVDTNNDNALHLACTVGSVNTVKYLIEVLQFNIETPGFNGQTPLHQSSYSGESPLDKMKYLISKGANIKTVDNNYDNALHLVCDVGNLSSVKYLIEELQFNIDTPGFNGRTPLHQSSYSKVSSIEKMKYLISKGVNVKTVDSNNNNALHLACELGGLDTVKYLIEELQFDIESPGLSGQTPLHQSCRSAVSPVEKINYLISKGVNLKTVDSQNNNVLHLACSLCSLNIVKYLIEELQFNIETPGIFGQTPLHQSSHSEESPIEKINYLISKGVNLKTANIQNNNALHVACSSGSLDTVKYIIEELQFNIETPGFTGRTPLHLSSQSEVSPVEKIKYLISKGANVQTVDSQNNNALHLACLLGSLDTVKYLIEELQFNMETPGVGGQISLHQSSQSEVSPVEKIKYLISKGVNVKTVDNNKNNNALHLACELGGLDTVKYIIEEVQFNIETPDLGGRTPLHQSGYSKVSPVEKIKYLISKGVNVKTVDNSNNNVLHLACSLGSVDTVKYLIEVLQFDIETPGVFGQTPLHQSSYAGESPLDKMKYLISKDVNVKALDSNYDNALHLACAAGSLTSVKYLIEELQFNIETPGFNGQTPLHQSSYSKVSSIEKMKYLIRKGVNLKTVDSDNNNALHLACELGGLDTVKYIIEELQFNIETPGFNGQTPLHQSSLSAVSPVEKIKYLISKGVNVKTVDSQNNNSLHLACSGGSLNTVKYLIEELQFNIDTPGLDGITPLYQSSQSEVSPVEKIKYLISKGAGMSVNGEMFSF